MRYFLKLRAYLLDARKREAEANEQAALGEGTDLVDFDRDVLRRSDDD